MDIKTLLPELKRLVTDLSEDLLQRSIAQPEVDSGLREAYTQIEKGGRTADAFEVWREDYLDQVAVAWVLGCVFVRFMEDNHLIDECWLAGDGAELPGGTNRRKLAEDTHELYFRAHPHESDREYFEHVFHEVGKIPACRDLFAEGKTPLWAVGPSGDAAMKLLAFWREVVPETGKLKRTFNHEIHEIHESKTGDTFRVFSVFRGSSPDSDSTRFLGDLYQDLSERARKKYALLQTPVFVEEFILDRTLDPAIDEFGLDEVRLIDPTCGSGHFLLGGFARLFDLWIKREDNEVVAAQKALDGVWGCDINPFAVAIARFRLIVAALRSCGIKRLKDAPAWNIHLATGDSLLFGSRWDREGKKKGEQQFLGTEEESWAPEIYACEDKDAISEVLGQQYHVVVGNPPYITVKDKCLNLAYRQRYSACHRQYSLAVPFVQRFFDLCFFSGDGRSGFIGKITANSFMKREFGKKLVEEFFPSVDLTHVVDTAGAYIPGHGTPTVILFGRNRSPSGSSVRAVLGITGEPSTPKDPAKGVVWQSIIKHMDLVDSQDQFMSAADVARTTFSTHPWSIGGGGAAELKQQVEECADTTLSDYIELIGYICMTRADELYVAPKEALIRAGIADENVIPFVEGDVIRDWSLHTPSSAVFPYDSDLKPINSTPPSAIIRFLWPHRTMLWLRKEIGGTQKELGMTWYEWNRFQRERYNLPQFMSFAFVATHNHFILEEGGKVFKQSAPIIKFSTAATEDVFFKLLGLLNSSTACLWMKQTFHNKGSSVDQHGARQRTAPFEDFYEYTGTGLKQFPVPSMASTGLAEALDGCGKKYAALLPEQLLSGQTPTNVGLAEAQREAADIRSQMIALQEELDWECYRAYELADDSVSHTSADLPRLQLGQRAFEIVMARQIERGEFETTWFERHGATPHTDIPSEWPEGYREVVERRIEAIEADKNLQLIEQPEYKRRWNDEPWEQQQERSLRNWLLNRLESRSNCPDPDQKEPRLQTIAEISDEASGDQDFLQVAAIYRGREDFDVAALIAELVESESVPFLPVLRYKPTGLRKREIWDNTWELQRREDAGEDVGEVNVPPKYASKDFQKTEYWKLRGKLDVPKERWISFPHCETESDPSLVVGWAGWNHLQQATALIAYYDARKREGWDAKRLTPLLAGLDQLLPWIHQWHPEVDPEFGETAGQSFETMLKADAHELGLTLEDIRAWEPPAKKAGGKPRGSKPRKTRNTRKKGAADEEGDNHE